MPSLCVHGVSHNYYLTAPQQYPYPVVFIHGWLLSHHYWLPVIEQLQSQYQCLTYDLRGFGASRFGLENYKLGLPKAAQQLGASCSPFGLAAYARDLHQLLTQLNLQKVWLVGHSLGASIALWAAYCYPQQIQGVISVNAGGGIYLKQEFTQFRQAGQQIVRFRPQWLRYLALLEIPFTRMMVAQPLERHWGRQRFQDLLQADPAAALGTLLETTTEEEVHLLPQIVSKLCQPTYFLAGQDDRVMEPKFVYHLASYHPLFTSLEGNVREIPCCGHLAMVEQPMLVVEHLQQWLGDFLG